MTKRRVTGIGCWQHDIDESCGQAAQLKREVEKAARKRTRSNDSKAWRECPTCGDDTVIEFDYVVEPHGERYAVPRVVSKCAHYDYYDNECIVFDADTHTKGA